MWLISVLMTRGVTATLFAGSMVLGCGKVEGKVEVKGMQMSMEWGLRIGCLCI
jgi:hypothetical protein